MDASVRGAIAGILLAVLPLAACQTGGRIEVRSQTTTTTSMTITLEGLGAVENAVRTEGSDTVVAFRGKTLVIRNSIGYTAVITPFSLRLEVGPVSASFDEHDLSVAGPDFRTTITVWKQVDGKPVDLLGNRKVIVSDVPPYLTMEGE